MIIPYPISSQTAAVSLKHRRIHFQTDSHPVKLSTWTIGMIAVLYIWFFAAYSILFL